MTPALAATIALICAHPTPIDGDTFRCGPTHVRLWGVDAPEHDTPAGPASTAALGRLLGSGAVTCHRKGTSYGRVVAMCWVDGRDLAGAMVDAGQAVDWPRYSRGYYAGHRP